MKQDVTTYSSGFLGVVFGLLVDNQIDENWLILAGCNKKMEHLEQPLLLP